MKVAGLKKRLVLCRDDVKKYPAESKLSHSEIKTQYQKQGAAPAVLFFRCGFISICLLKTSSNLLSALLFFVD